MFTIEEKNLIYLYQSPERAIAISDMNASLPHVYEPEMAELLRAVIGKLENITDGEYTAMYSDPDNSWNEWEE